MKLMKHEKHENHETANRLNLNESKTKCMIFSLNNHVLSVASSIISTESLFIEIV